MSPEQHAKVLEALEIAHNAALNEALELRVRQGGYMNHRQKGADAITDLMSEALSIMRAVQVGDVPKSYRAATYVSSPQGGKASFHFDSPEEGEAWFERLVAECPAPPTEHEVKP